MILLLANAMALATCSPIQISDKPEQLEQTPATYIATVAGGFPISSSSNYWVYSGPDRAVMNLQRG